MPLLAIIRNHRFIYAFDAVGSLMLGLALVVLSVPLAAMAGTLMSPSMLAALGAALVLWSIFNTWIAMRPRLPRAPVAVNIAGDALWVAGSMLLVAGGQTSLTPAGSVAILVLALMVFGIGLAKFLGLQANPSSEVAPRPLRDVMARTEADNALPIRNLP